MIECAPTPKLVVESVALPPLTEPVPRVTVPFLNVTVPLGAPPDKVGTTTAVNVTGLPRRDGLAEDDSVVGVVEVIEKLTDLVASSLPALSVL